MVAGMFGGCRKSPPLPAPSEFVPERYLGTWYEVARLPVFYQPDDTMAQATYGATPIPGRITVFNRSFDRDANPLKSISGYAELAPGDPPGRLTVRFPGVPSLVATFTGPNYYVIYVDREYRHAIVGIPSRKALWILSRQAPIPRTELDDLIGRAAAAGFDTERLIIAPWPKS
jgi:apolipoprotein D and lipocalin family protein